jgi:peptidoglycan/LPS O-acetylase OafA/YrhL
VDTNQKKAKDEESAAAVPGGGMVGGPAVAGFGPFDGRIAGLDGVRAVAVLGVIASHSGLINLGWVGVDLFFGLSGYLITGILLDSKQGARTAREFFVAFYMRRTLRIFPLALAFALVIGLLTVLAGGDASGLGWYLVYLVNWLPESPEPSVLGHYWSLAVEEQFYLVWPAVVYLASRHQLLRISVGLLVFDVAYRLALSTIDAEGVTNQFRDLSTPARADSLILGALLAQTQRLTGWGSLPRYAPWITILALAGIVGVRLLEKSGVPFALTYNLKWPVVALAVGSGLMWVLHRPLFFLEWSWMRWLGKVSYGVYIIHAPFGRMLHEWFPSSQSLLIFALQLVFTWPLAALSWYLFEAPILRLKRYWPTARSGRSTDQPGGAAIPRAD